MPGGRLKPPVPLSDARYHLATAGTPPPPQSFYYRTTAAERLTARPALNGRKHSNSKQRATSFTPRGLGSRWLSRKAAGRFPDFVPLSIASSESLNTQPGLTPQRSSRKTLKREPEPPRWKKPTTAPVRAPEKRISKMSVKVTISPPMTRTHSLVDGVKDESPGPSYGSPGIESPRPMSVHVTITPPTSSILNFPLL